MLKQIIISVFLFFSLFVGSLFAQPATKEDIRILRDDIKLLIQQMDKRFETVDKRFESLEKSIEQRFNMLMWFIGILTTLSTVSIAYIVKRQERNEENFREFKEVHLTPHDFIQTIRLMNPEEKKELKQLLR